MAFLSLRNMFDAIRGRYNNEPNKVDVENSALPTGAATEAKQTDLEALVGALASAAVTDPTASASQIALFKGILKQLQGDGDKANSFDVIGSVAEKASAKHTQVITTVSTYNRAALATQIEVYVESGSVRVRTDGVAATATTGEPLTEGFMGAWAVASISVYYVEQSTITVVSR